MRENIRLVVVLALVGLIVIFTIQNVAEVEIQFLAWAFQTRRAILIFFVLAIGILIGWTMHSVHIRKKTPRRPSAKFARESNGRKTPDGEIP